MCVYTTAKINTDKQMYRVHLLLLHENEIMIHNLNLGVNDI
jgi:hypothetical protein